MEPPHPHNHSHCPETSWGKRLLITMIMNLIIPAVQILAGIMAGSMALISDALHNLSDFASILISYMALKIGKRGPTPSLTFGYRRVEVMAAVFNVALLFGAALYIAVEGWIRLKNPAAIQGNLVIWAALLGVAANGISTWMLQAGAKKKSQHARGLPPHADRCPDVIRSGHTGVDLVVSSLVLAGSHRLLGYCSLNPLQRLGHLKRGPAHFDERHPARDRFGSHPERS